MIKNLLCWEPLGTDAVLIANGPTGIGSYSTVEEKMKKYPHFIVGTFGLYWPHDAFAWVGLHSDRMTLKFDERESKGLPGIKMIVPRPILDYPAFVYRLQSWRGGSSALYGAEIIRSLGYERVHVFGVDLTGDYEVFRPYWRQVNGLELIPYGESLSWMR